MVKKEKFESIVTVYKLKKQGNTKGFKIAILCVYRIFNIKSLLMMISEIIMEKIVHIKAKKNLL